MSYIDYLCLLLVPALLSAGQFLFKRSADSAVVDSVPHFLDSLLVTPYFWAAMAIYGVATLLWVFMLSRIPLSGAMPFVALTFVIVPIISVVFLDEKLDFLQWFGMLLIIAGICIAA